MVDNNQSPNVGVVTEPSNAAINCRPVVEFLDLLDPLVGDLHLAAAETAIEASGLPPAQCERLNESNYTGVKSFNYLLLQLHVCLNVWRMLSDVDLIFLHKGTMSYFLPALLLRLSGTKFCAVKIGAYSVERRTDPSVYSYLITLMEYVTFYLANGVIVFGENEINSIPNDSVFVTYTESVDFEKFDSNRRIDQRDIDVGFVGRFASVKRISELTEAVVAASEEFSEFKACLIGDGELHEDITTTVEESNSVELTGWVDYDELPKYYQRMQVLVLPSVAEGLPTAALEAMGCGTIVAATPVGSLPSILHDGETGFIINEPTSDGILETLRQIEDHENLQSISTAGQSLVRQEFSKEQIRENLRELLATMDN